MVRSLTSSRTELAVPIIARGEVRGVLNSESDVEVLAARVDEAFSTPFMLNGLELTVTASVGVARATTTDSPAALHVPSTSTARWA